MWKRLQQFVCSLAKSFIFVCVFGRALFVCAFMAPVGWWRLNFRCDVRACTFNLAQVNVNGHTLNRIHWQPHTYLLATPNHRQNSDCARSLLRLRRRTHNVWTLGVCDAVRFRIPNWHLYCEREWLPIMDKHLTRISQKANSWNDALDLPTYELTTDRQTTHCKISRQPDVRRCRFFGWHKSTAKRLSKREWERDGPREKWQHLIEWRNCEWCIWFFFFFFQFLFSCICRAADRSDWGKRNGNERETSCWVSHAVNISICMKHTIIICKPITPTKWFAQLDTLVPCAVPSTRRLDINGDEAISHSKKRHRMQILSIFGWRSTELSRVHGHRARIASHVTPHTVEKWLQINLQTENNVWYAP